MYLLRFLPGTRPGAAAVAAEEEEEEDEDEEEEMEVSAFFLYFFLLGFRPFLFREPFGRPVVPPFLSFFRKKSSIVCWPSGFTRYGGDALSTRHAFALAFAPFRVLKFRVLKYCRISPFVINTD
jgi:hypothetical protein